MGKQSIDSFAKLVAISLVYRIMVILCGSLLVPVVILFALRLAVIGAFVVVAVTGHALDLSALIGLLMLTGIVVTNAIVLLDFVQHTIEASADVRTALIQATAPTSEPNASRVRRARNSSGLAGRSSTGHFSQSTIFSHQERGGVS